MRQSFQLSSFGGRVEDPFAAVQRSEPRREREIDRIILLHSRKVSQPWLGLAPAERSTNLAALFVLPATGSHRKELPFRREPKVAGHICVKSWSRGRATGWPPSTGTVNAFLSCQQRMLSPLGENRGNIALGITQVSVRRVALRWCRFRLLFFLNRMRCACHRARNQERHPSRDLWSRELAAPPAVCCTQMCDGPPPTLET